MSWNAGAGHRDERHYNGLPSLIFSAEQRQDSRIGDDRFKKVIGVIAPGPDWVFVKAEGVTGFISGGPSQVGRLGSLASPANEGWGPNDDNSDRCISRSSRKPKPRKS